MKWCQAELGNVGLLPSGAIKVVESMLGLSRWSFRQMKVMLKLSYYSLLIIALRTPINITLFLFWLFLRGLSTPIEKFFEINQIFFF